MLTRFLFWNLRRLPLAGVVATLVSELDADFAILAECNSDRDEILSALNARRAEKFWVPHPLSERLQTFTRLPRADVAPSFDDSNG